MSETPEPPTTTIAAREILDAAVAALGGARRPGQEALTDAVATTIDTGGRLVAEAPTGSGKSLAYLAAAVASGRRTVVSTATIALQDQLVGKDLPHLAAHAGVDLSYAVLKGRSNYLCRAKLQAAASPDALFDTTPGPEFAEELAACQELVTTATAATTGDRAEAVDVSDATWALVSCSPMECPGASRCDHGAECFAELAIARAADADVVVVNHALLCLDLALGGRLLPEHDLLVVDEAHALPDAATSAFGLTVSAGGLLQAAARGRRVGVARSVTESLERGTGALSTALGRLEGRVRASADTALADALGGIAQRLAELDAALAKVDGDADPMGATFARQLVAGRREAVGRVLEDRDDDVAWVEGGARPLLRAAPIDVAPLLGAALAGRTAVLVSATLGAVAPFLPFARAIGLDPADDQYRALAVPPTFDWREQALLYVPKGKLPVPNDAGWAEAAGDELARLVGAAGGRTLVLCTGTANVTRFAALLRERVDVPVLAQGEGSRAALATRFRTDEQSVLVGTRSFWEGLDVPGRSCVLVVIDKLPFPTPADPLLAARRERVEAAGGQGWRSVDLPAAALALSQGVGRLLRTTDDRGVVAVLDVRLAENRYRYRTVLLDALPPLRRSIDVAEVERFLADAVETVPVVAPAGGDDGSEPERVAARRAVACPACDAPAGTRCRDETGMPLVAPHDERLDAYRAETAA
jgi:ATP-dependent DNA helicase DinG